MSATPLRDVTPENVGNALRTPPHNYEAERALLGAIFMNNKAYDEVAEFLAPDHFADPVNGRLYKHIATLLKEQKPANPVTLKSIVEADELAMQAGGMKYLGTLAQSAVTIINAAAYGRLIVDLWHRRELIVLGEDLVNAAFDAMPDTSGAMVQEAHEAALNNFSGQLQASTALTTIGQLMSDVAVMWDQRSREGMVGLSYGLPALDWQAGLMQPGQMIVIGGRPSMGKTALARVIAVKAAKRFLEEAKAENRKPKHVVFFSGEMPADQQAGALLTAYTNIMAPRRKDSLTSQDVERLVVAAQEFHDLPLIIDDTPAPTLTHMRQVCRRVQRKPGGVGLIIGDYLQLFGVERGVKLDGPVQIVTYLSKGWKELCRVLNVPGIVLSQLNRGLEQRDNKRPMMSDLRESGAIEQDADVIMFVYRDEYYLERDPPQKKPNESLEAFNIRSSEHQARLDLARGKAEAIVAKARLGSIGTARLEFDGPRMWFTDPKDFSESRSASAAPAGHPVNDPFVMDESAAAKPQQERLL